MKLKPVAEQVIVITGGSSGIGLATAKRAARMGARLVLAARTRPALAKAVDMVAQAGGEAAFVVALRKAVHVDPVGHASIPTCPGCAATRASHALTAGKPARSKPASSAACV